MKQEPVSKNTIRRQMELDCDCKDWQKEIRPYSGGGIWATGRIQFGAAPFRFCPWCSNPLKESDADSVSDRDIAAAMGASLEEKDL